MPGPWGRRVADEGHRPVLLEEALHWLGVERGGSFVDCTLGLGGHAEALLERSPEATLLGIDRDPEALGLAGERLSRFGSRVRLVRGRFADLGRWVERGAVSGILADLGVSSMQLDRGERGFSFRREGPLDMRMGGAAADGESAADLVRERTEEELRRILRDYGEERHARRIARAIVDARENEPIETTGQLARIVEAAKPGGGRPRRRGTPFRHPATQTFQALRVEVNRELEELETMLEGAVGALERDGRLVVISYQSLEDRLVKTTLRNLDRGEKDPVTGRTLADSRVIEVLTKKPVGPSEAEVADNPRARSARLRAARRL